MEVEEGRSFIGNVVEAPLYPGAKKKKRVLITDCRH